MITYEGAPSMSGEKYIGLDVYQATISVAVMAPQGKLVMESILQTKASTITPGTEKLMRISFSNG